MQVFAARKTPAAGRVLRQLRCFNPKLRYAARIMKITGILLLAGCLQLSARGLTQTVSITVKDAPLLSVLKAIEKQTDFTFILDNQWLKKARNVTITANKVSLQQVLDLCFKDQPLTYSISGKVIIISPKEQKSVNENIPSQAKFIDVRGRIINEDGDPVVAASVTVKGGTRGTTTNENGEFFLPALEDNDVLIISGVNIDSREIKVAAFNNLTVTVRSSVTPLQETVIRGYYTEKRITQVGNVTKVKGIDIERQPIADPVLALQGRVAGLQMSLSSGIPGAKVNVQLRGRNSLRFDANSPLFIVDGIPFPSTTLTNVSAMQGPGELSPFSSINMDNIESIEVLKDADATAIYGSRGANGVILITTKKGRPGKTRITANISAGAGKVSRMLNLLNTQQYLQIRHEALQNDGITTTPLTHYDINGTWDTTSYTDWQKIMIGKTAHFKNAQLSISGGSDLTQFLIGGSYRKETTIFPGNYNDQKSSVYLSITNRSDNRKFNSQLSASYVNDNSLLPTEDFANYIFLAPTSPKIYNSDGSLNWANDTWFNPFASLNRKSTSITTNLTGNLNISYTLLPGLDLRTTLGYSKVRMNQSMIIPLSSYSPSASSATFLRKHQFGQNEISTWNVEPQVSYNRQISEGKVEILIGATFQETINNSIAQTASNFLTDVLIENIAAAPSVTINNMNYVQYRYNAVFGRLGYNWRERYLVNLTGRRDGSTRFGPKNQFGNFGAVGLGWIFSKEKFIADNLRFLSFGKIRGSYGTTGNDQISDYQYLSTYSVYNSSYLGSTGLFPSRIANPYFRWEMIRKLEFGLELGFLKDRILLSSSFYRNRTDNQLVGYSLPVITGFSTVQANLPALIQNKGLEFELNTSNVRLKDFSWNSSFNISFPKNKLLEFPNLKASSYSTQFEVGKSLFASKKYHYLGVDPQMGIIKYQDFNNDGFLTFSQDAVSTKENTQKYFGGLNNSFSYKGFSLDVFFQFVKQTGYIYLWNGIPGARYTNQPTTVLNRWRKPGDDTNIPKLAQSFAFSSNYIEAIQNFSVSDGQVADASFIRLKNVSLSYTLPRVLLQRLKLTGVKAFMTGQNLFTITNYKGLDPEVQSITRIAPIRMLTGGLQITF